MTLTLETTYERGNTKHELYTIGRYEVEATTYNDGCRCIRARIERGNDRYTPEIFTRDNFEGEVLGFTIQTTSYGALNADEIQKVIAGYNEALQVVEILTKEFIK